MTDQSRVHGQKRNFRANKIAAAAILDCGKIAITLPRIDGLDISFTRKYKMPPGNGHGTKKGIRPKF